MTDEAAMLALASGDIDKAAVLYERYKRAIMGYFYKNQTSKSHCEDLTQQTFLRMISYRKSFGEHYVFKPWIYRIAYNILQDFVRKQDGNNLSLKPEFDVADDQDSGNEEQTILLGIALNKLPEEYRQVIMLSRFQELKYHEIADILGISMALVKVRVHRGLKILREIYIQQE